MAPKKQGYSKPSDEGVKSPTPSEVAQQDLFEQLLFSEDLTSMMAGSSTDTLEDCMNRLKALTIENVKKYKTVKSEVKKRTKELNALNREKKQKEKLEEKKEIDRQMRQARFTLHVTILGKTIDINTTGGATVGELRKNIISALGVTKKNAYILGLVFNNVVISASPRKTLIKAGLRDGDTIVASFPDNTVNTEGDNLHEDDAVSNLLDEDEDESSDTEASDEK